MVNCCANPDCGRELRYLREGKVYVFALSRVTGSKRLEHFWLCGECFKVMGLVCVNHREVRIVHRGASYPERQKGIQEYNAGGT